MLAFLLRNGMRKGFLGGSRFWTIIGAGAVTARLVRRFLGSTPEVVYREELRPGESLVISNVISNGTVGGAAPTTR